MTIKYARKILGRMADNMSDEEILRDIKAAELLKNIFFSQRSSNKFQERYNTPNYGKT